MLRTLVENNVVPLVPRLGLLLLVSLLGACSVTVTVRDVSVCEGRQACLAALQGAIESYWRLPACTRAGMKTTLGLVLPEQGPVAARIVASSGFQEFDEAALMAARLASGDIATRRIREGLGGGKTQAVEVVLQATRDGDPAAPACAASFVWNDDGSTRFPAGFPDQGLALIASPR
jgi:hypothetical protein